MMQNMTDKYPGARITSFGDTAELMDTLAGLVVSGEKTATCSSYSSWLSEPVHPGEYFIVVNSRQQLVCVIQTRVLRYLRFCDVSEELAALEGEDDKTLTSWRSGHEAFFTREGTFSPEMALMFEEFILVERL